MIIINFTHPLTEEQRGQVEALAGQAVAEIRDVACRFDEERPFAPQIEALVDGVGLSSTAWQTEAMLINPPAYAPAVAVLMAELHGRIGYFPAVLRLRPVGGSTAPRFEVAEIVNLHEVRAQARGQR